MRVGTTGPKSGPYALFDYCARCSRNLCEGCMSAGCCGQTPGAEWNPGRRSLNDEDDTAVPPVAEQAAETRTGHRRTNSVAHGGRTRLGNSRHGEKETESQSMADKFFVFETIGVGART